MFFPHFILNKINIAVAARQGFASKIDKCVSGDCNVAAIQRERTQELQVRFWAWRGSAKGVGLFPCAHQFSYLLPPVFLGFFDGGTTFYDSYEEWCRIAFATTWNTGPA